jgi:hypothetical protein
MNQFTSVGNWKTTTDFLKRLLKEDYFSDLDHWGELGVEALVSTTPVRSGILAHSWRYRIIQDARGPGIEWYNVDINKGVPIAILVQYGHATGTGGYVQGIDYINPAMRPVFDLIVAEMWKKVSP